MPTAPTLVREPFHRDGWIYEEKVDGWRVLAYKDRDRVRLVSRNGRDHTRRFHDIAAAVAKLVGARPGARRRGRDLRREAPVPLRLAPRARARRRKLNRCQCSRSSISTGTWVFLLNRPS